jgi:hypothetical protein
MRVVVDGEIADRLQRLAKERQRCEVGVVDDIEAATDLPQLCENWKEGFLVDLRVGMERKGGG